MIYIMFDKNPLYRPNQTWNMQLLFPQIPEKENYQSFDNK